MARQINLHPNTHWVLNATHQHYFMDNIHSHECAHTCIQKSIHSSNITNKAIVLCQYMFVSATLQTLLAIHDKSNIASKYNNERYHVWVTIHNQAIPSSGHCCHCSRSRAAQDVCDPIPLHGVLKDEIFWDGHIHLRRASLSRWLNSRQLALRNSGCVHNGRAMDVCCPHESVEVVQIREVADKANFDVGGLETHDVVGIV